MQYKTIVLELLQEQYPALHDQLRSSRTLLSTMEDFAATLKCHHEDRMDRLALSKPGRDPMQIASEALELAIEDLRGDLPSESPREGQGAISLDAAMSYVRRHTPPA